LPKVDLGQLQTLQQFKTEQQEALVLTTLETGLKEDLTLQRTDLGANYFLTKPKSFLIRLLSSSRSVKSAISCPMNADPRDKHALDWRENSCLCII
jgi:hypothetical protein